LRCSFKRTVGQSLRLQHLIPRIAGATSGGRFGGYGFYLLKGKPVFLWNLIDLKRIRWEGSETLAPGKHNVEFDFKYDGLGEGIHAFK
jgi:hypothetical protein